MELDFAVDPGVVSFYPFKLNSETARVVDWRPMMLQILADLRDKTPAGRIAAKFHNTLAEMILAVARELDMTRIGLTGGCFQNRYLTERTVHRLRQEGFHPYWHQRKPPNDGGIAFGQIVAAQRVLVQLRTLKHVPYKSLRTPQRNAMRPILRSPA